MVNQGKNEVINYYNHDVDNCCNKLVVAITINH